MAKSKKGPVNRRGFLKGAAAGAAALATGAPPAEARPAEPLRGGAPLPTAAQVAAETQQVPLSADVVTSGRPGSDFMVDVMKSMGFNYCFSNPGSSFRGLQESLINHGGNSSPEWITCLHEEISVAMADGYAQVEGRPELVAAHGTVGIQHAAMNIYNSFAGRVPVYIIAGNSLDAATRRPGVEWLHSVQDVAAMSRDYLKWDDNPVSLPHFAESAIRAYKIAMTLPHGPVLLVADSDLQEEIIPEGTQLRIPRLTLASPPQGDSGAVEELAGLLVQAENPVIRGRRMRSQEGMDLLVELAETLQAPVQGGMPSNHPLAQAGSLGDADVILGLQVRDFFGTINAVRDQMHRTFSSRIRPDAKLATISTNDLYMKSNYQDFQRYAEVDISIPADPEATLPALIEACRRLITGDRRRVFEERGRTLTANKERALERARQEARYGWNSSPISYDRISAELWDLVKDQDWALAGGGDRFFDVTRHYQTKEGSGAAGVGYGSPAAVGAALAHRNYGRLVINRQNDGDLMYAPGSLWTAAHHEIPFLSVMRNNRSYHQEVMHLQRMANRYQRGTTSASTFIGTAIEDPDIDYASLARSMGVYGEGPIENPNELRAALQRAIEVVQRGEPALVDVVTQPR